MSAMLPVAELSLYGVVDAGRPNLERVALYVRTGLQMANYGLMIGLRLAHGDAIPIRDNLFWFGNAILNAGDWIYVYTGAGKANVTPLPNTDNNLYSIHWGRKTTVFQDDQLVPVLFRMDAITVPPAPPQLAGPQQ